MIMAEAALQQAARLFAHWRGHDVEAVVQLLAALDPEQAQDVITGLLLLDGRSAAQVREIAFPCG